MTRNGSYSTFAGVESGYGDLVEAGPDIIFTATLAGQVTSLNPAFTRLTGWPADAWIGQAFPDLIHPDDVPRIYEQLDRVRQGRAVPANEVRCRTQSGGYLLFEVTVTAQKRAGEIVGLIGIGRDITARRATEEALRISEERFATVFRSNPLAMAITRVADGQILEANQSWLDLLGYTAAEIRGHTTTELGMWGDPQDRTHMIQAFREQGVLREFESSYRRKTGEVRPSLSWIEPIIIHGESCLLGIVQDISARKQAEALLRESEDRYRSLVEQSSDAILLTSPDGQILAANPAATRIFGWKEAEIRTLGRAGVVDVTDTRLAEALATRERTGQFKGELRYRRADGTVFPGEVSSAIFTDREGHPRTSMIIRDISESKATLAALQATNTQLQESLARLEQHTEEVQLLGELGAALQSCFHLDAAYEAIARFIPRLFAGEAVALCVPPTPGAPLVPVVQWNPPLPVAGPFTADECLALRQNAVYVAEGPQARCPHDPGAAGGADLCIPLPIQDGSSGVFCLRSPDPVWPPARYERAQAVGDYLRLALSNVTLRAAVRREALHDALTGLFNRRYMEAVLDQELARQARDPQPLAVIMLDLDYFKQINDRFGHQEGDRVLQQVGLLLAQHIRRGDLACRYGGEEFVLILPNTEEETAVQRAADLRMALRQLIQTAGLPEVMPGRPLTFSAGLAVTPPHPPRRESLLRAADAALYEAKRSGRDQIVISVGGF